MHRPHLPPGDQGFPGRQALRQTTVTSVLTASSRGAPPCAGSQLPPKCPEPILFSSNCIWRTYIQISSCQSQGEILYLNWMKFELEVMLFNKNVWF